MMTATTEANLFTSYTVRSNTPIVISHMQFVDDTLLIGVKSWENVKALRDVLFIFEVMSGLKVNFHKSVLVGINIDESWVHEAASLLSCLYLGICRLFIWAFLLGVMLLDFFGNSN